MTQQAPERKLPVYVTATTRKDLQVLVDLEMAEEERPAPIQVMHVGCPSNYTDPAYSPYLEFYPDEIDPPHSRFRCRGCWNRWEMHEVEKMSEWQLATAFETKLLVKDNEPWPEKMVEKSVGKVGFLGTRPATLDEVLRGQAKTLADIRAGAGKV